MLAMEVSPAIRRPIGPDVSSGSTTTPICCREQLPSGFSFVVDDVDAGQEPELDSEPEDASSRVQHDRTREVTPDDKRQSDARIQQIKGEAESRKNEFARLLEEHAQVVSQLKQMEDEPSPSHA